MAIAKIQGNVIYKVINCNTGEIFMKEKAKIEEIKIMEISRIKERAACLARSINDLKSRGVNINPYEPIEGKMFWPHEI